MVPCDEIRGARRVQWTVDVLARTNAAGLYSNSDEFEYTK